MRHLNRVLLLFPLLLLYASSSSAQTVNVSGIQTAKGLRDLCRDYIGMIDGTGKTTLESPMKGGQCLGYIQGVSDAFDDGAGGILPKSLKPCVPEKATMEELVRVFLKFTDDHPEHLSYLAADVVWHAMITSYPCPAKGK